VAHPWDTGDPDRNWHHIGATTHAELLDAENDLVEAPQVLVATLSSDMYKSQFSECTVHSVEVSVTELRAHLSDWLDRARAGGEVVITDRGIPVARLAALDSAGTLERLTAEGVIGKATAQRPVAAGRSGPRPRRPVSDRVSDQRR
jgi:prevent-host-death family protein